VTGQMGHRSVALSLLLLIAVLLIGCDAPASADQGSPAEQGQAMFKEFGCITCHAVSKTDKEVKLGPPLAGVYESVVPLTDGRKVKADHDYLRQSILQPDAATVEGYQAGVMVAGIERFKSRINSPGTVEALVEYIKSLK
jgi:cytochrome c oxidase subunit II